MRGWRSGATSAFFERRYPGIVFQAVALTMGVLVTMLIIYRTGAIKATPNFTRGVIAATGAICLVYLMTMGMRAFGMPVSFMHSSGPLGIGISMVVVFVAALNLVLDFDFIEKGAAERRAEVHGVVRRVRPAGNAGLAVRRDPATCSPS